MNKSKIASTLYVPTKDDRYLLDSRGAVRIYKSKENLQLYLNSEDYDQILTYELK